MRCLRKKRHKKNFANPIDPDIIPSSRTSGSEVAAFRIDFESSVRNATLLKRTFAINELGTMLPCVHEYTDARVYMYVCRVALDRVAREYQHVID